MRVRNRLTPLVGSEVAMFATGGQLERICRGYRGALAPDQAPSPEERTVRRRELPGGMVRLEIVLSPDEADLVMRAINRAREVSHAQEKAEGPVCVSAESKNATEPAGGEPGQVTESAAPATRESSPKTPGISSVLARYLASDRAADDDSPRTPAEWPSRADGMVTLAESFLAGHLAYGTGGDRFP